jgi:hypothetical protein
MNTEHGILNIEVSRGEAAAKPAQYGLPFLPESVISHDFNILHASLLTAAEPPLTS